MRKRLLVVIGILAAGGVGYVAGLAKTGYESQASLLTGNAGLLTQRVDLLARLRAGETEEVIRRLESSMDSLVLMAGMQPGGNSPGEGFVPEETPTLQVNALKLARVYADAVPTTPLSQQSQQILSRVEPKDTKYCSPALRALQESSSRK